MLRSGGHVATSNSDSSTRISYSMDLQNKVSQNEQGFRFMLEEYKRIGSLRLFYYQQGENRGRFFLTITSTSIGVLAVLSQSSDISSENLLFFSEVLTIVLIFFGLNVLNRLAARAALLKIYKQLLDKIQEYFSKRDSDIAYYIELQKSIFSRKKRLGVLGFSLEGTLSDLMMFVISLLAGGLVFEKSLQLKIALSVATVVSVLAILFTRGLLRLYYEFLKRSMSSEL